MDRKQCGSSSTSGADADGDSFQSSSRFTADELEVADIMLQLPELISISESSRRLTTSWGGKRKRSVIDAPASESPKRPPVNGKADFASTSPTSPLAFSSHIDLDCKQALPNKESVPTGYKAMKEGLSKECERLTEFRDHLKEEVKKMELFRDELIAEKMKLEETRQLMHQCVNGRSDPLELQLINPSQPSAPPPQQEPLRILKFHEMGPRGIPDLNVPAEQYDAGLEGPQPSDMEYHQHHHHMVAAAKSRAEAAALARQHRLLIQKRKKATRGNR